MSFPFFFAVIAIETVCSRQTHVRVEVQVKCQKTRHTEKVQKTRIVEGKDVENERLLRTVLCSCQVCTQLIYHRLIPILRFYKYLNNKQMGVVVGRG